ncbi:MULTISPECIES: aromatase/cyclase [unclassified Streptomyces]|uniref:aromatase/cyclase n=1 Tax=unclassified Streptomyces TaxID=2593676 RepID=UPI0004C7A992|nr:aromatase/cyclase [Streptomyces sp. NRRL F-2747]
MSVQQVHRTSYSVDVNAPAGVVYGLIADTTQWPLYFPSSIHVERLDFDGSRDRFHIWVTANGSVRYWLSHRTLDESRLRIDFRQEVPAAPAVAMGGSWIVEPRGSGRSRLVLLHDFAVAGDRAADVEWTKLATDTNSRAQLATLKEAAEGWTRLDGLRLSFEDSVRVNGPSELVYQFLYEAADWPGRVPHVARVAVTEQAPGVQLLSMDTVTADGSAHTTESVRVCFPAAGRIVYKQTATPALMAAHTGEWSLIPDESGVTAVSQHSVLLREEAIERVLGPGADLATARTYVREALGRNSTATLGLAKEHAETAVRML